MKSLNSLLWPGNGSINGNLPEMPPANQLINKAVEFIEGTVHVRANNIPIRQYITAVKVVADIQRPRQAAAAQAVHAATFAFETAFQEQWQQKDQ
jgi:hypothetical protein